MSAAPVGLLPQLRQRMRDDIGVRAVAAGRAFDEFVDAICRCWNIEHWSRLARSQPESQAEAVKSARVLIAKVREDVEAMWGDSEPVRALYAAVGHEAVEVFARMWFASLTNRTWMRAAILEARKA